MTRTLFLIFSLIVVIIVSGTFVVERALHYTIGRKKTISDDYIEQKLSQYIDKNADKIVEKIIKSIREEKSNDNENKIAHYKNEIFDLNYPHIGNNDSNIIVVGFFDYSCGYCKIIKDNVKQLINDGKIKYIFRDTPILGGNSLNVAKSALAVYFIDKAKYFDFHDAALSHTGAFSNDDILNIVKDIGIDEEDFHNSIKNNKNKIEPMLDNSRHLMRNLGVSGIPFTIIGDSLFVGATDLNTLRKKIDEQFTTTKNAKDKG